MNLLRSYSYSRLEKEDPEERRHRKAQFLIYKVLEQAECHRRRKQTLARVVISRFRLKIGLRLKKLGIRRSRVCVGEKLTKQLKRWKQAVPLTPLFA
ncbi:hypothetical protein Cni_G00550 [Canna indica]|uniref:Uncharacterized protein n=1 Tax=Canna indica TaxID=4628 RepID=A0AAQ3JMZ8_9LILI|nr:hypothetical protein Cni_G00550 [Canna indica]